MKLNRSKLLVVIALLAVVAILSLWVAKAPRHPMALLRVEDATGKPIADAIIRPEGMRTKSGPYHSGWYVWRAEVNGVPNPPVTTDADGYAAVPHPKYVFERIETGTLCLSVNHPDFVPQRPECVVASALPAGAPWKARAQEIWDRLRHRTLITHPDPIVLQKGAVLRISVDDEAAALPGAHLFAQVSALESQDTNFWIRPKPGVILTRRLAAGSHTVRAVLLDAEGAAWFSDVMPITAMVGQTNEVQAVLKRGVAVRGELDHTVPRPVQNGRVIAHVWPFGCKPQDSPPQWHAWAPVQKDGRFTITSLPEGDLELVALCDGYVSTNGPGQSGMRYPQKHTLGTNDLSVTLGMEPTARLEVTVTDGQGQRLEGVRVTTWPNVRYGEWSATILAGDCYNTSECLLEKPAGTAMWGRPVRDFQGVSDQSGLAVLPNLPANVRELAVRHPEFTLPIVVMPDGRKNRYASFTLIAGHTNRITLQLERTEESEITHY